MLLIIFEMGVSISRDQHFIISLYFTDKPVVIYLRGAQFGRIDNLIRIKLIDTKIIIIMAFLSSLCHQEVSQIA